MEDLNFPPKNILNFFPEKPILNFPARNFLQIIENVYPIKNSSLMAIGTSEEEEEALVTL